MNVFIIAEETKPGSCNIHGIFPSLASAVANASGFAYNPDNVRIEEVPFGVMLPNTRVKRQSFISDAINRYTLKGDLLVFNRPDSTKNQVNHTAIKISSGEYAWDHWTTTEPQMKGPAEALTFWIGNDQRSGGAGRGRLEQDYPGFCEMYRILSAMGFDKWDVTTLLKYFLMQPYVDNYAETLHMPGVREHIQTGMTLGMPVSEIVVSLERGVTAPVMVASLEGDFNSPE